MGCCGSAVLYCDDVVTGLRVGVCDDGISVLSKLHRVAVRLSRPPRRAIAEIPGLLSVRQSKCTHFESHDLASLQRKRWEVRSVDRNGIVVAVNVHSREVVSDVATCIL